MRVKPFYILSLTLVIISLATMSCSTTCRLKDGDVLYTGVKKLNYKQDSAKIDSEVKDLVFTAINVKPNNPLYSPYYRTPLPVGLWVYNHWDPKAKGLKGWLYKKLVSQPVLISRVRPQTRVDMIQTLLHNNGYFNSSANYELNYSKSNPKKASITYNVNIKPPHRLGEITYLEEDDPVSRIIDSLARANKYLRPGKRYCVDSLNNVRISITNSLRNKGYYFFKPEYIEYLADSVTTKNVVNLQLVMAANVPNMAHTKYLSRNITAHVSSYNSDSSRIDTVETRNCTLIKMQPVKINNRLIPSCLRSRRGKPFRVSSLDMTQMYLARTGIFSSVAINAYPDRDTITPDGYGFIDIDVNCVLDKPMEVKFEARGTHKSTSYIGPGVDLGIKHKNLWGGGEHLSADLTACYEWQTGGDHSSNFNSYEFGLDLELAIPRLLAPRFIDRSRRYINWTRVGLDFDIMNRPKFFRIARASAEFSWEWHGSKHSFSKLTPFKLTYSKLLSTTNTFDSIYHANRYIEQSFEDKFIPEMNYTYTFDKRFGNDNITWTTSITEAGNVCWAIWKLAGKKNGEMKMFGTPFAQYIKGQTQVVWDHGMGGMHLVGRVLLGAAHAYGNGSQVPYMEQFFIGGSNSLRGFPVRSVGPGSYHDYGERKDAYYDQTGTFKFETNWELRFPILGYLHGALFAEAGNVWLLEDDGYRPEGVLKGKNFFKELALDAGLGLRFDMGMLVLRADLGMALHAPYDTGKSGYFNIPKFKDSLAFHIAIGYPF